MSMVVVALFSLALGLVLGLYWRSAASKRSAGPAAERRLVAPVDTHSEQQVSLAVAAERNRIYNDLHDDLGAGLLELIYSAPSADYADRARAVLQDLRDVVSRSRGAAGNLDEVLGDIRREATQRLSAVGCELRWQQPEDLPARPMSPERALHLYRIVREAISNALRHAHARRLRVRVKLLDQELLLDLTDDGEVAVPAGDQAGQGMRSMQSRADQLQGDIRWLPGTEGGTKVLLRLPLT